MTADYVNMIADLICVNMTAGGECSSCVCLCEKLHLCQYDRRWRVIFCVCVCPCESTPSVSI